MISNSVRVLLSRTTEPLANLATEEWLFEGGLGSKIKNVLYLWRNSPTVVIGAHQNAFRECDLQKMSNDQVILARRRTGGGAVFHDLGNTNFTFIGPTTTTTTIKTNQNFVSGIDVKRNISVVLKALKHFGIEAQLSGRNDIVDVGSNRKISGSAFRKGITFSLHHGTLLINTDLTALSKYLTPSPLKLQSKGVTSTKSRVINISDLINQQKSKSNMNMIKISHEKICSALADEFAREFIHKNGKSLEIENVDDLKLEQDEKFQKMYSELKSWNWRLGNDPQFQTKFEARRDWGTFDLRFDVQNGRISNVAFFTDSLLTSIVEIVSKVLCGLKFCKSEVQSALITASNRTQDLETKTQLLDLSCFLSSKIPY